jgi:hypothetical protein
MIRTAVSKQLYNDPGGWLLPILITLASFNGLGKAISGVRFGPLLIDVGLVAALSAWLMSSLYRNRLKYGILDILTAAFIIFAIFEMFNPNIPSFLAGLEGFRKFAFMMIGIFIGRYMVNLLTIKRFIALLLISSFFIALYGIKQYIYPTALDYRLIDLSSGSITTYLIGGHLRAFSTLSGPFHLGIYLVCTLLLILCLWFRYKSYRWWISFLAIPELVALIMTVTKSNWAALLVGGLVIVLLNSKNPLKIIGRLAIFVIAILLIGVGAFYITSVLPQLSTIHSGLQSILDPLQAPTMLIRLDLWKRTIIPQIQKQPWIGYGTGSAGEGLNFYFVNTGLIYAYAHNVLIKIQFELGIFGLLLFLLLMIICIFLVWKVNFHLQDPFLKTFSNWVLAFTAGMLVSGLTGTILDAYPVNLIFWLILGFASRALRFDQSIKFLSKNVKPAPIQVAPLKKGSRD